MMKKFNKKSGFTIIELIVVIAIIAVLASIVLVNVTQYIAKGKNAAIKGNMATLLTNGADYYDSNNSTYIGFDTDDNTGCNSAVETAIANAAGELTCVVNADGDAFCACSKLNTASDVEAGSTFCVDSTGKKIQTTVECGTECAGDGTCQ